VLIKSTIENKIRRLSNISNTYCTTNCCTPSSIWTNQIIYYFELD